MTNKVISIEYTLNDANTKEKLDTNVGAEPLEFITGQGQIIPGLEKEIENLNAGDNIDVLVNPEDAYGEYNNEAIQTLPKEQFEGIELQKGMTLYGQSPDGQTIAVTVVDFDDKNVTIDYNHPLAGEDLTFDVKVVTKRDATLEELAGCEAGQGCYCGSGCGCH